MKRSALYNSIKYKSTIHQWLNAVEGVLIIGKGLGAADLTAVRVTLPNAAASALPAIRTMRTAGKGGVYAESF